MFILKGCVTAGVSHSCTDYWLSLLTVTQLAPERPGKAGFAALLSTTNILQQGDESMQRIQNSDFSPMAAASFHSWSL